MMTRYVLPCVMFVIVGGTLASHQDPECPRHRGLPDGFVQAENRFRNRAHFILDLRSALTGYTPNVEYRFRVQTTVRKHKFDDATVVLDALDAKCGTGSWIVESDILYSPKDCPAVVTTQQKQPMGRAHFIWRAPSCGCVHMRARVHANSTYYIEDENVHNGPLAKTICPKPGTVVAPEPTVTTTIEPHHVQVSLSRDERLALLCDVTKAHGHNDVIQYEYFMTRRRISKLNHFEMDRLSMAVQRRHLDVLSCCNKNDSEASMECFGDIRRNSIDSFCGTGEPDIPLAKGTYKWIKQKENECCPQIGEHRYRCFNQTLHDAEEMQDGYENYSHVERDDFDPVNFIQDYPTAGDMREEFIGKKTTATTTLPTRHKLANESNDNTVEKNNTVTEENIDDDVRTTLGDVEDDKASMEKEDKDAEELPIRQDNAGGRNSQSKSENRDTRDEVDTGDYESEEENDNEDETTMDEDDEDDVNDDDDREDNKQISNDEESVKQDSGRGRILSIEECCMNGIDVGTKVASAGFDGCFKMANKYNTYFKNWHRKCDLHFVVCCMRVIDGGKSEEDTVSVRSFNIHKFVKFIRKQKEAYPIKHLNKNRKPSFDSKIFIRNKAKRRNFSSKLLKHKNQNFVVKSKFIKKAFHGLNKILDDTSNNSKARAPLYKQPVRHISKNFLLRHEKELKYKKWRQTMTSQRKQNSVLKTLNSSKGGPAIDLK